MALELRARVHGMQAVPGMMHRLPLLHFHDFDGVGHVLHLDEKTSLQVNCGRRPRIANPNYQ
jgi:hypothetical protein